ncbi:MAG: Ada metal-binding domain-containing protein [Chitinophagaceae bacterium]
MIRHTEITDEELKKRIKDRMISAAGNDKLMIYGNLHCRSGKRMRRENRVFFQSVDEAIRQDFRPCGNCCRADYTEWKRKKKGQDRNPAPLLIQYPMKNRLHKG